MTHTGARMRACTLIDVSWACLQSSCYPPLLLLLLWLVLFCQSINTRFSSKRGTLKGSHSQTTFGNSYPEGANPQARARYGQFHPRTSTRPARSLIQWSP
jgi:hypothetical protein